MKRILLSLALVFAASSASALQEGAYELTGYNNADVESKPYKGWVIVTKKGRGYDLVWKIGDRQTQRGVALLNGGVLSVAYIDNSGQDAGVVSYRVTGKTLDGLWMPHGSSGAGREILVWKSASEVVSTGSRRL